MSATIYRIYMLRNLIKFSIVIVSVSTYIPRGFNHTRCTYDDESTSKQDSVDIKRQQCAPKANKGLVSESIYEYENYVNIKCFESWLADTNSISKTFQTNIINRFKIGSNKALSQHLTQSIISVNDTLSVAFVATCEYSRNFQHMINCMIPFASLKLYLICNPVYVDSKMLTLDYLLMGGKMSDRHILCYDSPKIPDSWTAFIFKHLGLRINENILSFRDCGHTLSILASDQRDRSHFYHPSHALQLASFILKKDPCRYYNKAATILSSPLKIYLLQRLVTRQLVGVETLLEKLTKEYQIPIQYTAFESLSPLNQGLTMENADLIIAAHGAAMANLFYMRPCSVIIEYHPWKSWNPSYFNGFANQSSIIMISLKSDIDIVGMNKFDKNCSTSLSLSCIKSQNIIVNVSLVMESVEKGLMMRKKCIQDNKYYNDMPK